MRNSEQHSEKGAAFWFLHRLTGAHELPQAGSALTGSSFSAPEIRGARTALACSPLTGGSFSAPTQRGTRTAAGVFALTGRLLSLHRLSGVLELPQACSPLTGGKFFAEPQRGDSPSADGGSVAAPAAGAKRKDNLRFSFLFELLPFPCFLIWRRLPTCDRFEIGVRQRIFSSVSFETCSQGQITFCYTCD